MKTLVDEIKDLKKKSGASFARCSAALRAARFVRDVRILSGWHLIDGVWLRPHPIESSGWGYDHARSAILSALIQVEKDVSTLIEVQYDLVIEALFKTDEPSADECCVVTYTPKRDLVRFIKDLAIVIGHWEV